MSSHSQPLLSAIFVDYDSVYGSLLRKNETAAAHFAQDVEVWLSEIANGRLVTPSSEQTRGRRRKFALARFYGNPMPQRAPNGEGLDRNRLPFVREHFSRAGFDMVECAPHGADLKSSANIPIVMDVRDYLHHETRFDEFIILSADSDFSPLLQRLRAHARGIVIYAHDRTAISYSAISDGEVREADLISLLLQGPDAVPVAAHTQAASSLTNPNRFEAIRKQIASVVAAAVHNAGQPLPVEILSDHAIKVLGNDKTIGTNWGGAGGFRELLEQELHEPMRLSGQSPYIVFEVASRLAPSPPVSPTTIPSLAEDHGTLTRTGFERTLPQTAMTTATIMPEPVATRALGRPIPQAAADLSQTPLGRPSPLRTADRAPSPQGLSQATVHQTMANIFVLTQAPRLGLSQYKRLFEIIAREIHTQGYNSVQTVANILHRALESRVECQRDDVQFILDVLGEQDPWFQQAGAAVQLANRFRNFIVNRCLSQGLVLTPEEQGIVNVWFTGSPSLSGEVPDSIPLHAPSPAPSSPVAQVPRDVSTSDSATTRWWTEAEMRGTQTGFNESRPYGTETVASEEFPRVVRGPRPRT